MTHSEKIDRLLQERGWPLRELARRTGFGRERVRRMAMRTPDSVRCAIRIAQVLEVPAEWLYDDTRDWNALNCTWSHSGSVPENIDLVTLRRELQKLLGTPAATNPGRPNTPPYETA